MRENTAVLAAIGRMEGNLRAARAYIYATAGKAWDEATQTGKVSEERRAEMRLAVTWTIHQAASVVDAAYHMAGATAVFRANPFERRFRDMHAIAQQIQARDNHYEDVGRVLLDSSATIPRGPTN
jgi:alkylation response protein AidB-like acyl-CoA dehydrogenase